MVPTFTLPPLLFSKASTRRVEDSLSTSPISCHITGSAASELHDETSQWTKNQQMKHWTIVSTESQVITAAFLFGEEKKKKKERGEGEG